MLKSGVSMTVYMGGYFDWRGHKLGYVPRSDNADIARRLDAGEALSATISTVAQQASAWDAVEFEITTA